MARQFDYEPFNELFRNKQTASEGRPKACYRLRLPSEKAQSWCLGVLITEMTRRVVALAHDGIVVERVEIKRKPKSLSTRSDPTEEDLDDKPSNNFLSGPED